METAIQPYFPEIDFATDDLENVVELMEELRDKNLRAAPVKWGDGVAWAIIRHADVDMLYRDDENLPGAAAFRQFVMPTMGRNIQSMEGDEHRVHRKMVSRPFLPRAIAEVTKNVVYPEANALVDSFKGEQVLDIVARYTRLQPLRVICAMLGIPSTDNAKLIEWIEGLFSYPSNPEGAMRAKQEITDYLTPLIHERRETPGDDIISLLATVEEEGERLDDEAILSMVRLLFPAGADTTYLAAGSMLNHILRDPDLYQHLLAHPEDRAKAVEESLRMYGPVYLMLRYTEYGFTLGDVDIPKESWLFYGNIPANYDPEVFPNPREFDLNRDHSKILTFAAGPHVCMGRFLARANMKATLDVLLERVDGLRLVDPDSVHLTGSVLRGPRSMQVAFESVRSEHVMPDA